MAQWIKMLLGMKVGLDPSDIVLDGTQLPPLPKGEAKPPVFGPYLLWPNGCMDQYESSSSPPKGHSPPIFGCLLYTSDAADE